MNLTIDYVALAETAATTTLNANMRMSEVIKAS